MNRISCDRKNIINEHINAHLLIGHNLCNMKKLKGLSTVII